MSFLARTVTPANGSQTAFPVSFPLSPPNNDRSQVAVYVHPAADNDPGTPKLSGTDFDWTSNGLITFRAGHVPAAGNVVDIRRETTATELDNTISPGGSLRSDELVENDTQLLYLVQEVEDAQAAFETSLAANATSVDLLSNQVDALAAASLNITGAVTAASKAAIALLSTSVGAVILSTEGSSWSWSNINYAARFGMSLAVADPDQAMYIAPSGDLTGAGGAWVRATGPSMWFNAEWTGLSVTGTEAANETALKKAWQTAQRIGMGTVIVPPKNYPMTTMTAITGAINIVAYGSRFFGTAVRLQTGPTADGVKLKGWWLDETTGAEASWMFDHYGKNVHMEDMKFTKLLETSGVAYCGFYRAGSQDCTATGIYSLYSNGIQIQGLRNRLSKLTMIGIGASGDDCFVFKAAGAATSECSVEDAFVADYGVAAAWGSEAGTPGADDPNFTYGMRGCHVRNISVLRCAMGLFVKPGSVAGNDYRGGYVEDCSATNITMLDPNGDRTTSPIRIYADRACRVRRFTIRDFKFNGRFIIDTVQSTNGILIFWPNIGTAGGVIEDVDIEMSFYDPSDGVPNGGSSPGRPARSFLDAELQTVGHGSGARISFLLKANGCRDMGCFVGLGLDDVFTFKAGTRLRNASRNTVSFASSIYSFSRIKIEKGVIIESTGGGGKAVGDGSLTTANLYNSEKDIVQFGTYAAAANSGDVGIFIAPVDCYVTDLDLLVSDAVAQSDVDYSTLTAKVGGTNFLTVTTKTTGGMALAANTLKRLNALTLAANACYMAKGAILTLSKTDTGAGKAINNAKVQVSYVPYGA